MATNSTNQQFIDGKTDEDWAIQNASSLPRFARVKPTTVHEPSILINHSTVIEPEEDEDDYSPFCG